MGWRKSEGRGRSGVMTPTAQSHVARSVVQSTDTRGVIRALLGAGALTGALAVVGYLQQHVPQFAVLAAVEAVVLLGLLIVYRWEVRRRGRGIVLLLLCAFLLIAAPLATVARLDLPLVVGGMVVLVGLGIVCPSRWWLLTAVSVVAMPALGWFFHQQSLWVRVPVLPDPILQLVGAEAVILVCFIIAGLSLVVYARRRSLHIRLSVTFGLLFVSLATLGLGAAMLLFALRSERIALTQMHELTAGVGESLTRDIKGLQDALVRVERLEKPQLSTLLGEEPGSQAFDYAYTVELSRFGVFAGHQATFDLLSLVTPEGIIVLSSSPALRGTEVASAALPQESVAGQVFSMVLPSSLTGKPTLMLIRPVRGIRGETEGFLIGEVALGRLVTVLGPLRASEAGSSSGLYLVDDRGQVLVSHPSDAEPPLLALKDLLQRRASGDGEGRFRAADGDVRLVTYHWFSAVDVGLILECGASSVVRRALAEAAPVWGLLAGVTGVALAGISYLSRAVTSPLRRAVDLVERFADGNSMDEVEWPHATSSDEAWRILTALRLAETQLRDVEAQAKHQIRSLERQVTWLKAAPRLVEVTANARDVTSAVRLLAAGLMTLPEMSWVGLWLLDGSGSRLVLKAAEGLAVKGLQQAAETTLELSRGGQLCHAFEMGRPIVGRLASEAPAEGGKVQLALPLSAGEQTYGVCEIHLAFDHVSQEELTTLQVLASCVSWAVSEVYRQLEWQDRLERIEGLWQAERVEYWSELAEQQRLTLVYDGIEVREVGDEGVPMEADLVLPIGDPQAPLGRLLVSRRAGARDLSPTQLAEARAILEEVTDALEQARLLAVTRQAWIVAQRMLEGLRAMMAAEAPVAILEAIMAYGQVSQLDAGWLALWEERWDGSRVLRLVGVRAGDESTSREVSQWWGRVLCPILYEDGFEERQILDVRTDQQLDSASRDFLLRRLGLGSALLCPIACQGEDIGWLILGSRAPLADGLELEPAVWGALMEYAGLALRRLTAFMKARDRAAREERMTIVGERVGRSTDVHTILQSSLRELGRLLRASEGVIYLNVGQPVSEGKQRATDQAEGASEYR